MFSSIEAEVSVAMMQVPGKREATVNVTAPVPAPLSRTVECLEMGDNSLTSSRRREAESVEVRPTLDEYVGAVVDQGASGLDILARFTSQMLGRFAAYFMDDNISELSELGAMQSSSYALTPSQPNQAEEIVFRSENRSELIR